MSSEPITFDGIDELSQTQEQLSDVYRGEIFAHDEDTEEWHELYFRDSLWNEDGGAVGDVSASEKHYKIIQFGDVVDATAAALDAYDANIDPKGYVQESDSGHKMRAHVNFPGVEAEPLDGDTISLGLQITAAHTGMQGISYDVGAMREVCSNGMQAFISELHYGQNHKEPLDYGLPRQAVAGIVEGVDVVENRLQRASEETFTDADEALLVLMDVGLDTYFDEPVDVLRESLTVETDPRSPDVSLYDTYNAATRAITHEADIDAEQRDYALNRAATLLDSYGQLPEATDLGASAVEQRVDAYADDEETEPYWEDEEETLHNLVEARSR